MATWLLTWNPKRGTGTRLSEQAEKVQRGIRVQWDWSCGRTKSIRNGDALYLLRQGKEPKGIVALATADGEPWLGPPWKGSPSRRKALYIDLVWQSLIDSETQPVLPLSALMKGKLARINWNTQGGGIRISDDLAKLLYKMWSRHIRSLPDHASAISDIDEVEAFEGEKQQTFVTNRRREARLRLAKVESILRKTGRLICEVRGCGFDFEKVYGRIGKGFAHVHHRKQLARGSGIRRVRLPDLAIVCPNCHAMIHRGGKCRSLKTLIPNHKRR